MTPGLANGPVMRANSSAGVTTRKVDASRNRPELIVFGVAFVALVIVKWSTLTEVPTWDSAMGLFPAATTLADSGFDIGSLIREPGYAAGGANVHSLSPVTWATALTLRLVPDTQDALIVLHLLHLAVAAGAATTAFRLGAVLYGKRLAALSTIAAFAFPLILTQTGSLYLEVPLLAATLLAISAWVERKPLIAGTWATVATLIKGSGLIVVGALLLAVLLDPEKSLRRPGRAALLLVAPAAAFLANLAIATSVPGGLNSTSADIFGNLTSIGGFLKAVPDLLLLLGGFVVATALTRNRTGTQKQNLIRLSTITLTVSFVGFYLAFAAFGTAPLPRYYTQIVPFLMLGIVDVGHRHFKTPLVAGVLMVATGFFAINRNGIFYPEVSNNNFAVAERSGEYIDLLALHRRGARSIEFLGAAEPVFYPLPYHFFVSHPAMGYVDGVPALGRSVMHVAPFNEGRLEDYPESFAMLYEFSWLGGQAIKSVWDQAVVDPTRVVTVHKLGSPPYESFLIQIDTVDQPTPSS